MDSYRIHAGDTGTYLKFTYTPTETIRNGQLIFKNRAGWSPPQNNPGEPGYTYISDTGTADIDDFTFDLDDDDDPVIGTLTVNIDKIDPKGTIEIHYGAYEGDDDGSGARAPATVTTSSPFDISIKGGDDATRNQPVAIKNLIDRAIAVQIYAQASGGGNAMATVSDNKDELGAGDRDREVTIVYTAGRCNK